LQFAGLLEFKDLLQFRGLLQFAYQEGSTAVAVTFSYARSAGWLYKRSAETRGALAERIERMWLRDDTVAVTA